nr:signal peptidase II [[Haemophilus] ducreyi]
MMAKQSGIKWLWLSLVVITLDLFSKYLVVERFELYESINILPIFNLTYARNYGAAFSFLADHSGGQKYLFLTLAIIISFILANVLHCNQIDQKRENMAYALIIGGAIGNAIDRAYRGYVVDFFDFYWHIYHYPVFNIADVAIVMGAGLLILETFLDKKKKSG